MKFKFFNLILLCAVLCTLCACDNDDFPKEPLLSKTIEEDFNARHENVSIFDVKAAGGSTWIDYTDSEGNICESMYNQELFVHNIRFYNFDNLRNELPEAVKTTYLSLKNNKRFALICDGDRIVEVIRNGINHKFYDFLMYRQNDNETYTPVHIEIDEDGTLLRYNQDNNHLEYAFEDDSNLLKQIKENYPDCDIRAFCFDNCKYNYILNYQGKRMTLTYEIPQYNTCKQLATIYENLQLEDIPANVLEQYNEALTKPENKDFILNHIEYRDDFAHYEKAYWFLSEFTEFPILVHENYNQQ